MKKRYLLMLGLSAFSLSLLFKLPAAPLLAQVNTGPIDVYGVGGSVWSGSAARVQAPDAPPLSNLNWSLRPLALFTGKAGADVDFEILGGNGSGQVARGFGGDVEIGPATLNLPASGIEQLLPLPVARFDGALQVDVDTLVMADGQLRSAQGLALWRGAKLLAPAEADLGEVRLDIAPDEEGHRGTLSNQGGELSLRGTLRLDQQGMARVDISLQPRNNASPALRDSLNLIGRPSADGTYRIRQQLRLSDLL